MIKKRSGAPPPRRRGAAVRASPAPRRPHSNSLRSRAAAASPDPSARPKGRDAQPRPLRCSRRASRARRSVLLPPRPPRAVFCAVLLAGRSHLQACPSPRPPPASARGNGLRAEFLETGSEACEPHERAPVRARLWLRRPRGGAPGGGPLSGARGPEDAGAGAGEGAGPRPAGGGRAPGPSGGTCPPAGTPELVSQSGVLEDQSRLQTDGRSVTKRKVFLFQVLSELLE